MMCQVFFKKNSDLFNLFKSSGYLTYHQFEDTKILHDAHTAFVFSGILKTDKFRL
jgi:hypothetical protein